MASTGAEAIVGALEAAGVEVAFGLPGVHNLALWEALRTSRIRLVGVRHEQAAAYAADGYARASGRTGVALTTTGPGRPALRARPAAGGELLADAVHAAPALGALRVRHRLLGHAAPLRRPGELRDHAHELHGRREYPDLLNRV